MWGREMRAGLTFVIAALLIGQGFREWRRGHEERFQEIVRELETRDSPGSPSALTPNPTLRDSASGYAAPARSAAYGTGRSRSIPVGRIDPNSASAADLERLPGIGPALAGRIVQDRGSRGAFSSPEALLRVPGIGPKILGRIRAYLSFSAAAGGDSLAGF
jgi:competence ComEA-like helix-hairpin-helix protein